MKEYKTQKDLLKNAFKDEYMCDSQLDFFEKRLKHDRESVLKSIENTKSDFTNEEATSDENDMASNQEIKIRNLRLIERQTKLLHKIENAIDRIHNGEFGYCDKTGEEIGLPRLLARPTATLSIEAKESQEVIERQDHSE